MNETLMTEASSRQDVRPNNGSSPWLYFVVCLAVLAAATAVRIKAACNELWLDEVWSLYFARQVVWPWDIITKIHHDNNHYLTTWFSYFIGPGSDWLEYRILSLLAGVGTVVLAGLIGRRRDAASALLAMMLTGSSYVLVLYSSEARGYAPAVFFSFLSFYSLDRYFETNDWPFALMFSLSAVLGLLSHWTFAGFYAAALAWSVYRLATSRLGLKQTVVAASSCHTVPILFGATLYLVDLRYTAVGGGTPTSLPGVYADALAWALGAPASHVGMLAPFAAAAAILIVGLRMLWRVRPDLCVFFAGAIVVFPLLAALQGGHSIFYVRFFVIGIAFFLILCSFVLANLYRRGPLGKTICVLLLLAYFAANGWHVASLFEYGRGHYDEAIRFMKEHSIQRPPTVGGDSDLRIGMLLDYYDRPSSQDEMRYYSCGSWPPEGPEWIVLEKEPFQAPVPPVPQLKDKAGNEYECVKVFPTAPLSGLHWFIYHKRATPPIPSPAPDVSPR
jgi:hypothetical protein